MRFLLIRHGTTDWNIAHRLQGREDVPLNTKGLRQAESCGEALSGMPIHTVLTSPLCRAVRTAEIIAAHTNGRVIADAGLTERDYGELSGKVPKGFDIFNPDESTPGLEPLADVSSRFIRTLVSFVGLREETVAVVSHGGAINAVLREISGRPEAHGRIHLYNGGISIIGYENGRFSVIKVNLAPEEFDKSKY